MALPRMRYPEQGPDEPEGRSGHSGIALIYPKACRKRQNPRRAVGNHRRLLNYDALEYSLIRFMVSQKIHAAPFEGARTLLRRCTAYGTTAKDRV